MGDYSKEYNRIVHRKRKTKEYSTLYLRQRLDLYFAKCPPPGSLKNQANFEGIAEKINEKWRNKNSIIDEEIISARYIYEIYNSIKEKVIKKIELISLLEDLIDETINSNTPASPPKTLNSFTQPRLSIFQDDNNYSKINFKARYLPVLGREKEFELLRSFWQSKDSFNIWQISGSAGTGKSKLALSFCEEILTNEVNAGFFEISTLNKFDWDSWRPDKDTFIVLDDSNTKQVEFLPLIKSLSQNKNEFSFRVRLLIIERNKIEQWNYIQMHSSTKEITLWNSPLILNGLPDEDLYSIFHTISEIENIPFDKLETTIQKFYRDTDPFKYDFRKTPLAAIMLAIVVSHQVHSNACKKNDVIDSYLNREKIRLIDYCRENNISVDILEKHINLAIISTLSGELHSSSLLFVLDQNFSWAPNRANFQREIYSQISEVYKSESTTFFGKIQPDIYGEYFVYKFLLSNESIIEKAIKNEIISCAFRLSYSSVYSFAINFVEDFSEFNKDIIQLLKYRNPWFGYKDEYWMTIHLIVLCLFEKGYSKDVLEIVLKIESETLGRNDENVEEEYIKILRDILMLTCLVFNSNWEGCDAQNLLVIAHTTMDKYFTYCTHHWELFNSKYFQQSLKKYFSLCESCSDLTIVADLIKKLNLEIRNGNTHFEQELIDDIGLYQMKIWSAHT